MKTFSFISPTDLAEESKWLLAVTCSEATNSVFNITDENNSFSITTPIHWSSRRGSETFNELQELWRLGAQNDIELHVKEVRQ